MFKDKNKNTRTMSMTSVLLFLLLTLNRVHTFFSVSIVDFEQVNVSWDIGMSPLTNKKVKPVNSLVKNHLPFSNHERSFGDFSVLTDT